METLEVQIERRSPRGESPSLPQVVCLSLDSTVPAFATDTILVAEASRRALISCLVNVRGRAQYGEEWDYRGRHKSGEQPINLESVLTGKDVHGDPRTGHAHAYFLPTDENGDGRIDRLTLFSRSGFHADELQAIDMLQEIRLQSRENGAYSIRVVRMQSAAETARVARTWISITPYIATRHAKARGRERVDMGDWNSCVAFIAADLRAQLAAVRADIAAEIIDQAIIAPLSCEGRFQLANRWSPGEFVRSRAKLGDDGARRPAGAFRIDFPMEVEGPIAIGTHAHFGMGLFSPLSP